MDRIIKRVVGVILIAFGLFALLTPLTPGSWLALVGLELLGFGFLIPRRVREWMGRKRREWAEWWKGRRRDAGEIKETEESEDSEDRWTQGC